jgi:uncharacterized membrane protein
VNIPVAKLPSDKVHSNPVTTFFGVRYIIPVARRWSQTVLAINMGGAIIPSLLSFYLLVKFGIYGRGLGGVAIVTLVGYWLDRRHHQYRARSRNVWQHPQQRRPYFKRIFERKVCPG